MPDEDSEGEDLMDDAKMQADYRAIQELDQYDPTMLAADGDAAVDHDARRAAEIEMARRDAARGLRPQGLDDDDYFDEDQDETYQDRQRRLKRMRKAAAGDEPEDVRHLPAAGEALRCARVRFPRPLAPAATRAACALRAWLPLLLLSWARACRCVGRSSGRRRHRPLSPALGPLVPRSTPRSSWARTACRCASGSPRSRPAPRFAADSGGFWTTTPTPRA